MKKWLCLLLTGILMFSLSACHRDQTPDTSSDVTDADSHLSSGIATDETGTNVTDTPLHTSSIETTEGAGTTQNFAEDISSLPLNEAYAYAVKQHEKNPERHRDIGEQQLETCQIVEIDGKYYQSYVASNSDIRYIWISQPEFPDPRRSLWDWFAVGTADVYSLELLGKTDESRR